MTLPLLKKTKQKQICFSDGFPNSTTMEDKKEEEKKAHLDDEKCVYLFYI